jgi:formylglycine-generating enzyme required for sulfatase activity
MNSYIAKTCVLVAGIAQLCIANICVGMFSTMHAQEPELYALVVGVTNYEKEELNGLRFPETDADAVAQELRGLGYTQVDVLKGSAAKKAAIEAKLNALSKRGRDKGIVFIFLSGHGTEIEVDGVGRSFFSPYDTEMKALRDAKGRPLSVLAPTADSMVSIDEVLLALKESKAAHRILITDCCRDDATRAKQMRSKSFGTSIETKNLPTQTVMLLSCSPGQTSLEHDDWGHGALTKCLLSELRGLSQLSRAKTMGSIGDDLILDVEALVRDTSKGQSTQQPKILTTGRVEIVLKNNLVKPKTFTSKSTGMEFVLVPAGEFDMGSPESELDYSGKHASDERQHRVAIARDFYLGQDEVTQGQFEKVMKFNPSYFSATGNYKDRVKGIDTRNHPVENITWFDALMFCNKLSESEGRVAAYRITEIEMDGPSIKSAKVARLESGSGYHLPTEAEWEYACRAGSKSAFSFGTKLTEGQANFGLEAKSGTTRPAARSATNGFGLRDMHGNVWEWCWDSYMETAYDSRRGLTRDPVVSGEGSFRVNRGGSWSNSPVRCRSANRDGYAPDFRSSDLGFRVSLQSVR